MKINRLDFIFYNTIFIILLLSAFFRIYNNSLFKILVPTVLAVLGVYYFYKDEKTKYFKLGILVLFLGHNANQYFFILLTLALFNLRALLPARGPVKYLYILFFVGGASYVFNQFIEWNPLSFPFFIASFFFSIVFFSLCYRYTSVSMKEEIANFYVHVILLLAIVAIIQNLVSGATVDALTGGTTNAHTLGFHMSVGFIYTVTKLIRGSTANRIRATEVLLLLVTIPVMYLADAKYLLLNAIVSIFIVFILFHVNRFLKPVLIGGMLILAFYTIGKLKTTEINISTKVSFTYMDVIDKLTLGAKYQLAEEIFSLPSEDPIVFFMGSGPGTFLSRASNSRAYDTMDKKSSIGGGQSVAVESKLPSFIPPHTSWVTHKYATHYFGKIWYGTLFDFRSSLISFFWEFGLIGFLVLVLFFNNLVKRVSKAQKWLQYSKSDAFFIQSFIVFYLLNSVLAYYFEYPETQILFWLFLGLFCGRSLISGNTK